MTNPTTLLPPHTAQAITRRQRPAARRRLARRARNYTVSALSAALLAASGYTALAAAAPLPQLRAQLHPAPQPTLTAVTELEAALRQQQPGAAAGLLDSDVVFGDDHSYYSIASITKVVTALVCLEQLSLSGQRPSHTFTAADADLTATLSAAGAVVAPVPEGYTISADELLQVMMLASANNYATIYSRLVFGSDAEFLAAARNWLQRHELSELQIVDAHGLSPSNKAPAQALIRLGRLALQQPQLAEVLRLEEVDLGELGVFSSTNPFSGQRFNRGIKTGTLDDSYYNLLVAAASADSSDVALAVVLARPEKQQRVTDAAVLLKALHAAADTTLLGQNEVVGSITTWQGSTVPLVAASDFSLPLRVSQQYQIDLTATPISGDTAAQTPIGTAEVTVTKATAGAGFAAAGTAAAPGNTQAGAGLANGGAAATPAHYRVELVTAAEILAPDLGWRLAHPEFVAQSWAPTLLLHNLRFVSLLRQTSAGTSSA